MSRYGERDTPKYRERGAPRRDRATKYRERNTAKMERAPRQESRGEDRTEFYNSLRSRLFGVLGRSCCMCGFGDERALGFGSKDDARIFDTVRRGGAASSWGRYVSKPDMARAELQVLCLNCNQLRQD